MSYSNGAAPGGAGNGLLNCLRQEYPQAAMRAVDFDGQSDVEIAEMLAAELFAECGEPEVGYVGTLRRSEEHTSELQSLMRISYAVLCLKKKQRRSNNNTDL